MRHIEVRRGVFVIEVTVHVGADHSFVVAAISGRLGCASKSGGEDGRAALETLVSKL